MTNKSKGAFFASTNESLCCCEYMNMRGDKSHMLAVCCDCEALDETFDKIFKCERIPQSTIDRLISTISDRCRLPTCFGQGAIKVRPDVVTPAFVVPACLLTATLHPVMTVLSFLFMPAFIVMFYVMWKRSGRSQRTLFFYSWGLTSVISSYLVFQFFVVAFREVLLWEILTVFTSMMIMFYFLYLTKHDPDQLEVPYRAARLSHKRTPSNPTVNGSMPLYNQVSGEVRLHEGDLASVTAENIGEVSSGSSWSSSGMIGAGKSGLPARAGYCKICECYISVRDHHCVWIDSCVGASNHRSFILAMVMFVITGAYSVHLTLTTICTPNMYLDWFLLPSDCRWLYNDFLTSICFVTAVYCILATSFMCVGLLYQAILISQNLTSHELSQARRQGLTRCVFFAPNNPNNHGFLRNWVGFWLLSSRAASSIDAL